MLPPPRSKAKPVSSSQEAANPQSIRHLYDEGPARNFLQEIKQFFLPSFGAFGDWEETEETSKLNEPLVSVR